MGIGKDFVQFGEEAVLVGGRQVDCVGDPGVAAECVAHGHAGEGGPGVDRAAVGQASAGPTGEPREHALDHDLGVCHHGLYPRERAVPLEHAELGLVQRAVLVFAEAVHQLKAARNAAHQQALHLELG